MSYQQKIVRIGIFSILLFSSISFATEYYVSPDGDNTGPGSIDNPWRTIAKANQDLQSGDTVYIRRGTYLEDINPVRSGATGSPIVYRNFQGEEVIIRGFGNGGSEAVVALGYPGSVKSWGSASHIIIQGLNIYPVDVSYGVAVFGTATHHIQIIDCHIYSENRTPPRTHGILISGAQHCLIEGNTINGDWSLGIITTGSPKYIRIRKNTIENCYGSSIDIQTSYGKNQAMLIEENILTRSRIEDGIQFEPDYSQYDNGTFRGVIIRNNVISHNAENAIDLKGAAEVVIEGNILYGNRGDNNGAGNLGGGMGGITKGDIGNCQAHSILIRKNFIYDNLGGISIHNHDWIVIHNTIIGNNRCYLGADYSQSAIESAPSDNCRRMPGLVGILMVEPFVENFNGCVVKNNIIAGNHQGEIAIRTTADLSQTEFDGNLYYSTEDVAMVDFEANWLWENVTFETLRNRLESISGVTGKEGRSFVTNSIGLIMDTDSPIGDGNFNIGLIENSPAIDNGLFLTKTLSSGSGTQIAVEKSRFFSYGYNIVDGDSIRIQSNGQIAIIDSIDYNGNVLYLNRPISWQAEDGLSLVYQGNAPDIGAKEYTTSILQNDPILPFHISDIVFSNPESSSHLRAGEWYDLILQSNDITAWSSLAFIDVWLSAPSYTEGNAMNRGGDYFSSKNYIISLSITDTTLWVKQTEGSSGWTEITHQRGIYVDAEGNNYDLNGGEGRIKVRLKISTDAEHGTWGINAVSYDLQRTVTCLYSEDIFVQSLAETPTATLISNMIPEGFQITVQTDRIIVERPSHLKLIESDSSITFIELNGIVPTDSFKGYLVIDGTVAEGKGRLEMPRNALKDENGNLGEKIISGAEIYINKITPTKPHNLIILK